MKEEEKERKEKRNLLVLGEKRTKLLYLKLLLRWLSSRRHSRWDSIPGSGRSPGEENGNQLQDSCLEDPMDRGAWRAMVHGVTKS